MCLLSFSVDPIKFFNTATLPCLLLVSSRLYHCPLISLSRQPCGRLIYRDGLSQFDYPFLAVGITSLTNSTLIASTDFQFDMRRIGMAKAECSFLTSQTLELNFYLTTDLSFTVWVAFEQFLINAQLPIWRLVLFRPSLTYTTYSSNSFKWFVSGPYQMRNHLNRSWLLRRERNLFKCPLKEISFYVCLFYVFFF